MTGEMINHILSFIYIYLKLCVLYFLGKTLKDIHSSKNLEKYVGGKIERN